MQSATTKKSATIINVLNKKDAAGILNISETLFNKLHERGIIPATVNAGFNNKGMMMKRWAEHHLIIIKPIITGLRHSQSEKDYLEAKVQIHQKLGL
jgi:hypothetical protein